MQVTAYGAQDQNGNPVVLLGAEAEGISISLALSPEDARSLAAALTQMSILTEEQNTNGG